MKKRVLTGIICSLILVFTSGAQDETIRFSKGKFLVGIGIHIGFFSPDDVSQYIESWLDDEGLIETVGFTDLVLNLGAHFDLGYRINDYVELYGTIEYSAGMKYIKVIGGTSKFFNFNRFSPGVVANALIPLSQNAKNSIFFGGGVFYHAMRFENYECNVPGFRGQFGFSLNNFGFNPQIYLAYDFANGNDKTDENFKMDYSGIQIGVNLNF
jgi:hypothetical protein